MSCSKPGLHNCISSPSELSTRHVSTFCKSKKASSLRAGICRGWCRCRRLRYSWPPPPLSTRCGCCWWYAGADESASRPGTRWLQQQHSWLPSPESPGPGRASLASGWALKDLVALQLCCLCLPARWGKSYRSSDRQRQTRLYKCRLRMQNPWGLLKGPYWNQHHLVCFQYSSFHPHPSPWWRQNCDSLCVAGSGAEW